MPHTKITKIDLQNWIEVVGFSLTLDWRIVFHRLSDIQLH